MTGPLVQNLTHVNVIVSDQAKALQWYQDVLGCEVATDQDFEWQGSPQRWLTVRVPGDGVELVLMPPFPNDDGTIPPAGDGPMIIFEVKDCQAFVDHARSKGALVTDVENMPWGLSTVTRDPDGNPFNLVQSHQN